MIHERIAAAKAEIEQLKYLISDEKNRLLFQGPDIDSNVQKTLRDDVHPSLKAKLGGRGERIYAVDWCSGSSDVLERLVSVGQVWNWLLWGEGFAHSYYEYIWNYIANILHIAILYLS